MALKQFGGGVARSPGVEALAELVGELALDGRVLGAGDYLLDDKSLTLPDPPAHHEELYRFLLARSHQMYGAHFSIGPDGDLYLVGRVLLEHLDVDELDRIIGVMFESHINPGRQDLVPGQPLEYGVRATF